MNTTVTTRQPVKPATRAKPTMTSKPAGKSASQQQPATPNPFTREYVASVYAARKASTPSAPRA